MKGFILFAAAASLIAGAEILHMAPGSAQQAASLKTINAKSLCGTWQVMPASGGFHLLTASSVMLKGSGLERNGDAVKYTITDATSRTAVAVETINMHHGQSFHIRDGFKSKAVRKMVGVTSQNMIIFSVLGESDTEIWTPLSPGVYDVVGFETGTQAMVYHYTIKQTSKSTCKAD